MTKKTKNRTDEIEQLETEIKTYKSLVRQLRRQLKNLKKDIQTRPEPEEVSDIVNTPARRTARCPECDGKMEKVKLPNREFEKCEQCGWRTKTKKI